jgi:hypothetical protein
MNLNEVTKRLKENWEVVLEKKATFAERVHNLTKAGVSGILNSIFSQMYALSSVIGIAHYVGESIQDVIIGFTLNNPSLVMSAILFAVLTRIASEKLTDLGL